MPATAPTAVREWRLPLAIALLSAAALAYQLLLMRWLAIAHWQPFAVMIISLALLGHGASGTWLSLWLRGDAQRRLARFERWFALCAAGFAVAAVAALAVAAHVPFNGLELVWNTRQLAWLAVLYAVLGVPFFLAAAAFGLAFARYGSRVPALYAADLAGAGGGALAAIALMAWPVADGLRLATVAGALAALLVVRGRRARWTLLLLATVLAVLPSRVLAPPANEYKALSRALLVPGARVVAVRHGVHGEVAVLDSPRVPLRHMPGLSLSYPDEPPAQRAIFSNGDAMHAIIADGGDRRFDAAGWTTSALPYRLHAASGAMPPRVLVLGLGGGQDVLQALALGARAVVAVEPDGARIDLLRHAMAGYTGGLLRDARVRVVHAEPRAFLRADAARYDIVVLATADAGSTAEHFLLTLEALRDARARLAPGGWLAATRGSRQPPRDELRWLATVRRALDDKRDPATHVVAIRSWDASTVAVGQAPLRPAQRRALRVFLEDAGFDAVAFDGMRDDEANRRHLLAHDGLHEGAHALLRGDAEAFVRDYKFAVGPTSDDRPYFGDSLRWRSLPELWRLREQGGAVLLESGHLLLVASLLQALLFSLVLVLLPLRVLPAPAPVHGFSRGRAAMYFLALGLAFLAVEIATLSRLTLLVGHPLLAIGVGLAGFLVFAGIGSAVAQRGLAHATARGAPGADARLARLIRRAVVGVLLGLAWQFAVFAAAMAWGAGWPVAARAAAALVGIAPLAVAMGMPFPLGLARLSRVAPGWVPWAWGLNGCASVLAAVGALLLAMAIGLRATLLCAAALYVVAAFAWPPSRAAVAR